MNTETLERANAIRKRIKVCKENIEMAEYTQSEDIVVREMLCKFNGYRTEMTIPPSLWRVVGKLVLAEYQQELNALESEFQNL